MINNSIFLVNVLSLLRYGVTGMPSLYGIYNGFENDLNNDTEIVEIVSNNELPEPDPDPNAIDSSMYGRSLYGQPDFNKVGYLVEKFKTDATSVNPEELGSYLEGDIFIPQNSLARSGLVSKSSHWSNGVVPFEISHYFTQNYLNILAAAIDEFHAKTCIRFKPRTTEVDFISITGGNSGCWSLVGRIGGEQKVNFQTPGCLTKAGTAMHELMHTLGFWHEQNRIERDNFVDIQLQNVQQDAMTNFEKMPDTNDFGVEYDYGSVMHYSPNAFSRNGQPTIVAKKPTNKKIMGQRDGFSAADIEKINRMYNCSVHPKPKEPKIRLTVTPHFPLTLPDIFNGIGAFFGNVLNGLNKFV